MLYTLHESLLKIVSMITHGIRNVQTELDKLSSLGLTLQKQIGCFNHKVVNPVADKLWLRVLLWC